MSNPEDDMQEKQARVNELIEKAQGLGEEKDKLMEELKNSKRPLQEIERKLKKLESVRKSSQKELVRCQRRLEDARNKIIESANSAESEEALRLEQLKQAEADLVAYQQKRDELRETQSKWLQETEELDPLYKAARSRVRAIDGELNGVRNKIRSLQSSADGNGMAVFGGKVIGLARAVSGFCTICQHV